MTTLSVRVVPVLLIGVSVGTAAVIAFQQLTTPPSALESSPTDGGGKADREAIIAIGTIEPKAGMLDISSSLIGHRIKAVHVNEAQPVEADEILIEIDDELIAAERELALAQQSDAEEQQAAHIALAKEQVLLAELALKELKASSQLEIATQQAQFAVLKNKEKQAERDRDRLKTLNGLPEPRVSTQQVEQQELLLELAKAETQAADAGIMQLKQTLTFKKQTAEAELRMAKRKLEQANAGSNVRTLKRAGSSGGHQTSADSDSRAGVRIRIECPHPGRRIGWTATSPDVCRPEPIRLCVGNRRSRHSIPVHRAEG